MLTDDEKARVRYFLGYPNTGADFAVNHSSPYPLRIQQQFIFEYALNAIRQPAEEVIRTTLGRLDRVEEAMANSLDLFEATRVGDINPNQNVLQRQQELYTQWAIRLCETLGVKPYSESMRFRPVSTSIRGIRLRSGF